jgi:ubiquinone/menaquinone biosynthesis C-methylase UbiE
MAFVPDEIRTYYETDWREADRITSGLNEIELVRTQRIVRRHLPRGPLRILDVGGGTGVHASWLAADGHNVHLIDPVPGHVDAAAEIVTAEVGDARDLPAADATFDAVLLLGPLYHLTEVEDRVRALREARRVVRPGGLVFVAAISRFASLFSGLQHEMLFDAPFRAIVDRDLREGQHRNPEARPGWFTTAYFHHPVELREEVVATGLDVVELLGVEGLAGWLPHLAAAWGDAAKREQILFAAEAVESEPTLAGLSAHLLLVAKRP